MLYLIHKVDIINRTKKSMSKFSNLQNTIAKEYEKAGMNKKKAESIGGGVAYKQGVKKLGKKKFLAKALRARKAHEASK